MVSLEVIDTDAFLDMPVSSQLLYFHLNSRADDDGFVANPKKIMRSLGGSSDDLKVIISKKFVIAFEDGVCVIKHWRINNFVRKDIYKETKYLDHKQTLFIRKTGAYTLTDDNRAVQLPDGHFNLEDVNVPSTQRQLRIGKVREGKDRKEEPDADASLIVELIHSFEEINPSTSRLYGMPPQRAACERLIATHGLEKAQKAIKYIMEHRDDRFCPSITTPVQLEAKWAQLEDYARKSVGKIKQVII